MHLRVLDPSQTKISPYTCCLATSTWSARQQNTPNEEVPVSTCISAVPPHAEIAKWPVIAPLAHPRAHRRVVSHIWPPASLRFRGLTIAFEVTAKLVRLELPLVNPCANESFDFFRSLPGRGHKSPPASPTESGRSLRGPEQSASAELSEQVSNFPSLSRHRRTQGHLRDDIQDTATNETGISAGQELISQSLAGCFD